MRRSRVIDTAARTVFHSALVLSLYLLFAGHNQPGGGFAGGLVAGAAIAVYYVAGGVSDVRSLMRAPSRMVLGGGLVVAATAAGAPLLGGAAVLESGIFETDLPLLGTLKVPSALAFEVGVYATVVGLVVTVFEAFGEDPLPDDEAAES